jgi:hypothetical protein
MRGAENYTGKRQPIYWDTEAAARQNVHVYHAKGEFKFLTAWLSSEIS